MATHTYIDNRFKELEQVFRPLERIIESSLIEQEYYGGKLYPENLADWQNLYGRLHYLSAQCKKAIENLEKGGCI